MEGVADAVFGDESVEDVEDGVAVFGVELAELVDAVGEVGVGWGGGLAGCAVDDWAAPRIPETAQPATTNEQHDPSPTPDKRASQMMWRSEFATASFGRRGFRTTGSELSLTLR